MAFTARTIVHKFTNADGTPCSGNVTFTLDSRMTNGGETRIPGTLTTGLDGSGNLSVANIAANDDPDTVPSGARWQVTVNIAGVDPDEYSITVPAAGSGSLDLGTLLPTGQQVS